MCLHPKKIRNRTRFFTSHGTPEYIDAPCGKCMDCRNKLSNEWVVKLKFEFDEFKKNGGSCLFTTLTYNDACLPKFSVSYNIDGINTRHIIPCFNSRDKDRFLNTLRKYFERRGIKGIKYMWCSEYGQSENGTHRSHYHILLLFPFGVRNFIPDNKLRDIIQCCWTKRGANLEPFKLKNGLHNFPIKGNTPILGKVRWSKDKFTKQFNMWVNDDFALRYASKYCVKDIEWYKQPSIILYEEARKKDLSLPPLPESCKPKHWQSHKLGYSLLEHLNKHPDDLLNGIDIHSRVDLMKKSVTRYQVPRLYFDKVTKDSQFFGFNEGKKVFFHPLNELGVSVKMKQFLDNLNKSNERFNNIVSVNYLRTWISSYELKEHFGYTDFLLFSKYLKSLVSNYKLFYVFNSVYKHHFVLPHEIYKYLTADENTLIELGVKLKEKQLKDSNVYHFYIKEKGVGYLHKFNDYVRSTYIGFDYVPLFINYNLFSDIINRIESIKKAKIHESYLKDREQHKREVFAGL